MGIIKKMIRNWKDMPTVDKVNMIIDAICGLGSSLASVKVGKELTKDSGIVEKICVRTAITGAGMAIGKMGANELKNEYGKSVATLIDKSKSRIREAGEKAEKEEATHE